MQILNKIISWIATKRGMEITLITSSVFTISLITYTYTQYQSKIRTWGDVEKRLIQTQNTFRDHYSELTHKEWGAITNCLAKAKVEFLKKRCSLDELDRFLNDSSGMARQRGITLGNSCVQHITIPFQTTDVSMLFEVGDLTMTGYNCKTNALKKAAALDVKNSPVYQADDRQDRESWNDIIKSLDKLKARLESPNFDINSSDFASAELRRGVQAVLDTLPPSLEDKRTNLEALIFAIANRDKSEILKQIEELKTTTKADRGQ